MIKVDLIRVQNRKKSGVNRPQSSWDIELEDNQID